MTLIISMLSHIWKPELQNVLAGTSFSIFESISFLVLDGCMESWCYTCLPLSLIIISLFKSGPRLKTTPSFYFKDIVIRFRN